jgi:hypothetical protein
MINEVFFRIKVSPLVPPITYHWTGAPNLGPLISLGDLKGSKIADTKVSGF